LPRVSLACTQEKAEVRLKDRFQDQLHGRLHHAILNRDAWGAGFGLGSRPPDWRKLIVMSAGNLQLLDQRCFLPWFDDLAIVLPSTPGAPWLASLPPCLP
jgi:hypothetical protein